MYQNVQPFPDRGSRSEGGFHDTEKKSFVLYFDSWPLIATLPPEQRGWLLSAVFDFAIRVAKDQNVSKEALLDHYPEMTPDTRMACGFICGMIARDTGRWSQQRDSRIQRRAQKEQKEQPDAGKYEEFRKIIERRKANGQDDI